LPRQRATERLGEVLRSTGLEELGKRFFITGAENADL
jgi:hypothetical protein